MSSIFELKRIVQSEDIDELNHVNNAIYVQWKRLLINIGLR